MKSLLQSKKISLPDQSRSSNPLNGSDAETMAASLILSACRGEVCWGSREEDNSKIDLILSAEHPWFSKERMLVLAQVKSGDSYGTKTEQGFTLKGAAIKAAKRTSHAICVLWVCRATNQVFWAYIHPNSNELPQEYSNYHVVSPATLFDLARCMSRISFTSHGGSGITIRRIEGNLTKKRKQVLDIYRKFEKIFSPALGYIEFTRKGWRHMFRANRSTTYKQTSLDLIPYLGKIITQQPSEHAITDFKEWEHNGFVYRSTEHLMKYNNIKYSAKGISNAQRTTVIIKAIEEIRYPKNWQLNAMLSQCIDRRVVLMSAYCKA